MRKYTPGVTTAFTWLSVDSKKHHHSHSARVVPAWGATTKLSDFSLNFQILIFLYRVYCVFSATSLRPNLSSMLVIYETGEVFSCDIFNLVDKKISSKTKSALSLKVQRYPSEEDSGSEGDVEDERLGDVICVAWTPEGQNFAAGTCCGCNRTW